MLRNRQFCRLLNLIHPLSVYLNALERLVVNSEDIIIEHLPTVDVLHDGRFTVHPHFEFDRKRPPGQLRFQLYVPDPDMLPFCGLQPHGEAVESDELGVCDHLNVHFVAPDSLVAQELVVRRHEQLAERAHVYFHLPRFGNGRQVQIGLVEDALAAVFLGGGQTDQETEEEEQSVTSILFCLHSLINFITI